ncbi:UNVERIFIED_CONTAM: hypothetical protein FKN15_058014 [Acipenser sinensis]
MGRKNKGRRMGQQQRGDTCLTCLKEEGWCFLCAMQLCHICGGGHYVANCSVHQEGKEKGRVEEALLLSAAQEGEALHQFPAIEKESHQVSAIEREMHQFPAGEGELYTSPQQPK